MGNDERVSEEIFSPGKEGYIKYSGDIRNNFKKYITKDSGIFVETEKGFGGKIRGDRFYIYKKYPFMRNSFRTVMYCRIMGDKVHYRFGKWNMVVAFVILCDALLLTCLINIWIGILSNKAVARIVDFVPLVFMVICTMPILIFPKGEKNALLTQLKKICGRECAQDVPGSLLS